MKIFSAILKKKKEFYIDLLINKLLQAKSYKVNKKVPFIEAEIRWLILKTIEILMNQPIFIELDIPLNIYGETHGQIYAPRYDGRDGEKLKRN